MDNDESNPGADGAGVIELIRVQPIEAGVIAARLRSEGIRATVGGDSVYPSLTVASGVPVLVPAEDALRARALLEALEAPEGEGD